MKTRWGCTIVVLMATLAACGPKEEAPTVEQLVQRLLDDPSALHEEEKKALVAAGSAAIDPLGQVIAAEAKDVGAKLKAVWVLRRLAGAADNTQIHRILRDALGAGHEAVRVEAAKGLIEWNVHTAMAQQMLDLDRGEPPVQQAALRVLAAKPAPHALPAMTALLAQVEDGSDVEQAAYDALAAAKPDVAMRLVYRKGLRSARSPSGSPAVHRYVIMVVRLASTDMDTARKNVVDIFGLTANYDTQAAVLRAIDETALPSQAIDLLTAVYDPKEVDAPITAATYKVMARTRTPEAVKILNTALATEEKFLLRRFAAKHLAQIGDVRSVELLLRALEFPRALASPEEKKIVAEVCAKSLEALLGAPASGESIEAWKQHWARQEATFVPMLDRPQ